MFSFDEVLSRIKNRFKNTDNRIEGSFSMDNAQAVAQVIAEYHSTAVEPIMDNISLDTAVSKYLDRKAIDFNMTRNPPLPSKGTVTITGTARQHISQGVKVQSAELTFTLLSDCTLDDSGNGIAAIQCDTAGSIGNIEPVKIEGFTLASTIYGCIVTNTQALTGGINIESDDAFRQRIYERIQRPITSGNANHYIFWAKQISGISDARCISCFAGAGTVKIVVFSNGVVTPQERVTAVATYIETQRPIGATVTVVPAAVHNVSIACKLALWEDTLVSDVITAIKTTVSNYINSSDKTKISYHKVSDLLYSIKGVSDVLSYTINGETSSIQVRDDEFIAISEVIVNVN